MGDAFDGAGEGDLSPAERLISWTENQRKRLVGESPQRLAQLIDLALLYSPSLSDPGGFASDIGVYRNRDVQKAAGVLRKKLPSLVKQAQQIRDAAHGDGQPGAWQDNVNPVRFLFGLVIDPRGENGDEMLKLTARLEEAIDLIANLPAQLPKGRRGGIRRDDAASAVVKAVCIYRQEQGLPLQYDFKIRNGGGEPYRNIDADTGALMVKVMEIWGIDITPAECRTLLRNFHDDIKERDQPPVVGDILLFPELAQLPPS